MKTIAKRAAAFCGSLFQELGARRARARMPAVTGGRTVGEIRQLVRLLAVNHCVWTA